MSADGPRLEEAANGESAENGRAFSADRVASPAGRDAAGLAEPTTRELVRWLTSQTRPVHRPLFVSTLLRIVNLSLDVVLFGLAAAGAVSSVQGKGLGSCLPVLVLVAMAKAAAYYLEQLTGHYVAFKALELLRTMVFSNLWPKAPAIVGATRSGDVLASLTRDVDRIEVVYAHTFAPVVSALVVPPVFVVGAGLAAGWQAVAIPAASSHSSACALQCGRRGAPSSCGGNLPITSPTACSGPKKSLDTDVSSGDWRRRTPWGARSGSRREPHAAQTPFAGEQTSSLPWQAPSARRRSRRRRGARL